jgi:hypothetical protein
VTVVATENADAHSLSNTPLRYGGADCFDVPCHLDSRHPRKAETRKFTLDRYRVGMTDSAGFNPDQNLSLTGLRYRSFSNAKFTALCDFECFIRVLYMYLPFGFSIGGFGSGAFT